MKADTASTSYSAMHHVHTATSAAPTRSSTGRHQVDHRELVLGQAEDVRAASEIGERRSRDIEVDRSPLLPPHLRRRDTADEQVRRVEPSAKPPTVHVDTCNVCTSASLRP